MSWFFGWRQILLAALVAVAAALPPQLAQTKKPIAILREAKNVNPDGSIDFSFNSEDGIQREETIAQRQLLDKEGKAVLGSVSRGSYSFTGDDGVVYTVNWVADENGFQASGDHLPKP